MDELNYLRILIPQVQLMDHQYYHRQIKNLNQLWFLIFKGMYL
jgi:hypothetical protein